MKYIDNNTLSSILDIDILNEIRNQINLDPADRYIDVIKGIFDSIYNNIMDQRIKIILMILEISILLCIDQKVHIKSLKENIRY